MEWLFVVCYVWAGLTTALCFWVINQLAIALAETARPGSCGNLAPLRGNFQYVMALLGCVTVPFTVIYLFHLKGRQSGAPDPK